MSTSFQLAIAVTLLASGLTGNITERACVTYHHPSFIACESYVKLFRHMLSPFQVERWSMAQGLPQS